ncbi:Isoaspartyl peptidase/L-asparaginase [Gracilariopsis chorda]|uniref:Isoaspartyl peptidase/L-asparaginase n=1 Tax=Gracilariopsis chorda TaxID=448386 RepID=A0A2V3ISU1_9FLOR|nr:Isoaspartyl peptidase/L-asparaginase [Gracilariopsis chorda]|eukprot:PXF45169.1 Isoaspartyl peptidase/L-asparaginase [Gracilariopsis chorda]
MTNTNPTSRSHHHRPPVIIVHGGAWAIPDADKNATEASVRRAASIGYELLKQSNSSLDAVEAAVRHLEDDPLFDAGTGSCLTEEGTVEMDAAIMHEPASGLRSGAVAAISNTANPVSVARAVMEKTQHCLVVGRGADAFANHMGMAGATPQQLVTAEAQKEWKNLRRFGNAVQTLFNGHDTVGAVAMDVYGNLACATSTGGITGKMLGRVGDSPLFGSGLFCDREAGACSTTGHGESIMQVCLARTALALVELRAMGPGQACKTALNKMKQRTGGCGGIILIDAKGNVSHAFTTKRMAWASVDRSGVLASGIDA